jgi:integrase/recombinase XerD
MNDSTREISPLRQRMIEDMRLRKLAPKTQVAYIRSVRRLASYLRRPPDTASVEDLRNFQLHLVDRGTSPITLNGHARSSRVDGEDEAGVCASDTAGGAEP